MEGLEVIGVDMEFSGESVFKGIKFILRGVGLLQACRVFRVTLRDGWALAF